MNIGQGLICEIIFQLHFYTLRKLYECLDSIAIVYLNHVLLRCEKHVIYPCAGLDFNQVIKNRTFHRAIALVQ